MKDNRSVTPSRVILIVPWVNRTILYRDGQRINYYQHVLTHNNSLGEEAGIQVRQAVDGKPSNIPVVTLEKNNTENKQKSETKRKRKNK